MWIRESRVVRSNAAAFGPRDTSSSPRSNTPGTLGPKPVCIRTTPSLPLPPTRRPTDRAPAEFCPCDVFDVLLENDTLVDRSPNFWHVDRICDTILIVLGKKLEVTLGGQRRAALRFRAVFATILKYGFNYWTLIEKFDFLFTYSWEDAIVSTSCELTWNEKIKIND